MRAPHHRRTEAIGACFADPFANGEERINVDTFTIPKGRRRRVYRPLGILLQCRFGVNSTPGGGRLDIRVGHRGPREFALP
jgi:hypothetical protein